MYTCFENTNKISVCRWQDDSEVTLASNFIGAETTQKDSKYSREEKKIKIPQPRMIRKKHKHMERVHLHDSAVSNYRFAISGRKWWWPLVTNWLNTASVNAWKIHCLIAKKNKVKPLSQIGSDASSLAVHWKAANGGRRCAIEFRCWEQTICENPQKRRLMCAHCQSQAMYQCKKCNLACKLFRCSSWLKIQKCS